MPETILLDPSEVSTSRTALDITPWIAQDGADWGDATIETFLADKDRGSIPVDYRVPNRPISIPLRFKGTTGGTTNAQARANIQAKIALIQKEGGWLKRITNTGGTVYADLVDGATHGFTSYAGFESNVSADIDPMISLVALPDFYQDEVTLSSHAETTNAEINFTETSIAGDYPARVRMVYTENQAVDQRGMVWGFRSRYYDSASTAALKYEAESLGTLDTAAKAALSGASGGTVVTHGTLSTNWTPVLSTNVAGTQYLTHKGTYRLYARIYSTSGTTVQARAVWDVGDLVNPVENDSFRLAGASNFYTHDFGELRLDAPPVGTYRWNGQIQARGDVGGENFSVDKIWLVPVDEGMGLLTSPIPTTQGLATYSARDEFNQTAGTLNTKVLPVGGTWVTNTIGAAAGDFSTSGATAFNVTRTVTTDTATNTSNGRFALAGAATYSNLVASVDVKQSDVTSASTGGVGLVARLVDVSNYLVMDIQMFNQRLMVYRRVTGTDTAIADTIKLPNFSANTFYTVRVYVDSVGRVSVYCGPQGSPSLVWSGQDSSLATGGALATGKVGLWDWFTGGTVTRTYDNFALWVPTPDAVCFASRTAQLTTDGNFRIDSGGTAYGPVSIQGGDLPRLPVAGLEGRTTEVLVKPSRGDFDQFPDNHTSTDYGDDGAVQLYYRPCFLNVGTI